MKTIGVDIGGTKQLLELLIIKLVKFLKKLFFHQNHLKMIPKI